MHGVGQGVQDILRSGQGEWNESHLSCQGWKNYNNITVSRDYRGSDSGMVKSSCRQDQRYEEIRMSPRIHQDLKIFQKTENDSKLGSDQYRAWSRESLGHGHTELGFDQNELLYRSRKVLDKLLKSENPPDYLKEMIDHEGLRETLHSLVLYCGKKTTTGDTSGSKGFSKNEKIDILRKLEHVHHTLISDTSRHSRPSSKAHRHRYGCHEQHRPSRKKGKRSRSRMGEDGRKRRERRKRGRKKKQKYEKMLREMRNKVLGEVKLHQPSLPTEYETRQIMASIALAREDDRLEDKKGKENIMEGFKESFGYKEGAKMPLEAPYAAETPENEFRKGRNPESHVSKESEQNDVFGYQQAFMRMNNEEKNISPEKRSQNPQRHDFKRKNRSPRIVSYSEIFGSHKKQECLNRQARVVDASEELSRRRAEVKRAKMLKSETKKRETKYQQNNTPETETNKTTVHSSQFNPNQIKTRSKNVASCSKSKNRKNDKNSFLHQREVRTSYENHGHSFGASGDGHFDPDPHQKPEKRENQKMDLKPILNPKSPSKAFPRSPKPQRIQPEGSESNQKPPKAHTSPKPPKLNLEPLRVSEELIRTNTNYDTGKLIENIKNMAQILPSTVRPSNCKNLQQGAEKQEGELFPTQKKLEDLYQQLMAFQSAFCDNGFDSENQSQNLESQESSTNLKIRSSQKRRRDRLESRFYTLEPDTSGKRKKIGIPVSGQNSAIKIDLGDTGTDDMEERKELKQLVVAEEGSGMLTTEEEPSLPKVDSELLGKKKGSISEQIKFTGESSYNRTVDQIEKIKEKLFFLKKVIEEGGPGFGYKRGTEDKDQSEEGRSGDRSGNSSPRSGLKYNDDDEMVVRRYQQKMMSEKNVGDSGSRIEQESSNQYDMLDPKQYYIDTCVQTDSIHKFEKLSPRYLGRKDKGTQDNNLGQNKREMNHDAQILTGNSRTPKKVEKSSQRKFENKQYQIDTERFELSPSVIMFDEKNQTSLSYPSNRLTPKSSKLDKIQQSEETQAPRLTSVCIQTDQINQQTNLIDKQIENRQKNLKQVSNPMHRNEQFSVLSNTNKSSSHVSFGKTSHSRSSLCISKENTYRRLGWVQPIQIDKKSISNIDSSTNVLKSTSGNPINLQLINNSCDFEESRDGGKKQIPRQSMPNLLVQKVQQQKGSNLGLLHISSLKESEYLGQEAQDVSIGLEGSLEGSSDGFGGDFSRDDTGGEQSSVFYRDENMIILKKTKSKKTIGKKSEGSSKGFRGSLEGQRALKIDGDRNRYGIQVENESYVDLSGTVGCAEDIEGPGSAIERTFGPQRSQKRQNSDFGVYRDKLDQNSYEGQGSISGYQINGHNLNLETSITSNHALSTKSKNQQNSDFYDHRTSHSGKQSGRRSKRSNSKSLYRPSIVERGSEMSHSRKPPRARRSSKESSQGYGNHLNHLPGPRPFNRHPETMEGYHKSSGFNKENSYPVEDLRESPDNSCFPRIVKTDQNSQMRGHRGTGGSRNLGQYWTLSDYEQTFQSLGKAIKQLHQAQVSQASQESKGLERGSASKDNEKNIKKLEILTKKFEEMLDAGTFGLRIAQQNQQREHQSFNHLGEEKASRSKLNYFRRQKYTQASHHESRNSRKSRNNSRESEGARKSIFTQQEGSQQMEVFEDGRRRSSCEILTRGIKRKLSRRQQRELTQKNYKKLPEVQKKKEEMTKELMKIERINRIKAYDNVCKITIFLPFFEFFNFDFFRK